MMSPTTCFLTEHYVFSKDIISAYFSLAVLGIQTRALHTLARVPPTELHWQPPRKVLK